MSRQDANRAIDQFTDRPSYFATPSVMPVPGLEVTSSRMMRDIESLAAADPVAEIAAADNRKAELAALYGHYAPRGLADSKPFAFVDGYAVIPVHGTLINRFPYSWGFVTGYGFIRSQIVAALADADVTGIVLDVNSYGGAVAGCAETADVIFEARKEKPILAMVDTNCQSAAYFLASQATRIVGTKTSWIGSIGVVLMHMDVSKAMADHGVKISFVYAGAHKVDGNPYEPLSDEVKADLQKDVDAAYDLFVSTVTRGRDLTDKAVRATEARSFRVEDALSNGLIDAVVKPDQQLLSYFEDEEPEDGDDEDDPPEKDSTMTNATKTADTTKAPATEAAQTQAAPVPGAASEAAVRADERKRIAGIQEHAEAEGRGKLARHLALNTDMSVEAAVGVLAASARKKEVTSEAASGNPFKAAMDADKHPKVGSVDAKGDPVADEDGEGANTDSAKAKSMLTLIGGGKRA